MLPSLSTNTSLTNSAFNSVKMQILILRVQLPPAFNLFLPPKN